MTKAAIEAPAPAPVADGIWRPQFLEERQAYVCQRYLDQTRNGPVPYPTEGATQLGEADPKLVRETYGARLNGPQGVRFSPMYLFLEDDAQAQCDRLNNG